MLRVFLVIEILLIYHLVACYAFSSLGTTPRGWTARHLFGGAPENKPAPKKDGGGLFGGMGNMMEAMKKAQEMAKQAETVNKELMDTMVVGQDPSGMIITTFNGVGIPISMKIADGFAQGKSADELSLACSQAMIDGHKRSQQAMVAKMQKMYADAGVPMPPAGGPM